MPPDKQEGPERQQVLETFHHQIADAVHTQPQNLDRFIKGAEGFLFSDHRYCCLINANREPGSNTRVETGFIKVTKTRKPDLVQNLQREAFIALHAQELGIPAVECLTPPTQIGNEFLLIQLQALSPDDGIAYIGKEMHVSAPPEVAAKAANAILSLCHKPIPCELDTSILDHQHERNASPESFETVWQNQNQIVFEPDHQEIVAHLCQTAPDTNNGIDNLHRIVDTAQGYLENLIPKGQSDSQEYLSHGDADLNNMFFKHDGKVILIDWETAAATHNWFLAQLTDLSNLFGRCWVDPEKQHQILSAIIKSDQFEDLKTRYQVAYSVAVFGSMYLAKYAMNPTHHEHPMSVALLSNLQSNLDYLDSEYQSLSQS